MLLLWIIVFSLLGSVIAVSLAGGFLLFPETTRRALVPLLVSYATGALIGAALLALLPHALEEASPGAVLGTMLVTILLLFALEKVILIHHCHPRECPHRTVPAVLILIGDGIHNLIDGIAIAGAFLTSIPLGIATGVAAVSHEVPQEVGDFGILLNAGYERSKAFLYNLYSGLTTFPGALAGYFLFAGVEAVVPYILAVAAGSFLYIGMADLVPHLHEQANRRTSIYQFLLILAGVGTILIVETFVHTGEV